MSHDQLLSLQMDFTGSYFLFPDALHRTALASLHCLQRVWKKSDHNSLQSTKADFSHHGLVEPQSPTKKLKNQTHLSVNVFLYTRHLSKLVAWPLLPQPFCHQQMSLRKMPQAIRMTAKMSLDLLEIFTFQISKSHSLIRNCLFLNEDLLIAQDKLIEL